MGLYSVNTVGVQLLSVKRCTNKYLSIVVQNVKLKGLHKGGLKMNKKELSISEKCFNNAFPILKPYPLNREIKEYIVDRKTGEKTQI